MYRNTHGISLGLDYAILGTLISMPLAYLYTGGHSTRVIVGYSSHAEITLLKSKLTHRN